MENSLSFTQKIKEELTSLQFEDDRDLSILSAFIRTNGSLIFSDRKVKLILKIENNKVAKYIYKLIKENFVNCDVYFSFRKMMKFNKPTQYIINVNSMVEEILETLKINFLDDKIDYDLTSKDYKIRGYLAGLFLATGSCSDPSSSNYHLEFTTTNEGFSLSILKVIRKIKDLEFNFKTIKRRNNYVIYIKKSDSISEFLAYIEATNSCLLFEDVRVSRDFANVSNRLINMDASNYKKTIEKAEEQINDIYQIDKWLGLKNISNTKLRELCYLRIENKEATYNELAALLSEKLEVPISKSNVNHLFIKIKELAKGYRKNEESI